MLGSAAKKRAWIALVTATLSEAAALVWVFRGASLSRIAHYTLTPPGNPAGWAAATIVTLLYAAYSMRVLPLVGEYALAPRRWREALGLKLFAVPMAFVTGYFEEAFFRRSIMDAAMHHGAGVISQIIISALSFGVVHGVWALFGGLRAGIGAVVATTILGGFLAAIYIAGERSLLPCAASHIAINLIIEPWLILSATAGRWGRA